MKFKDSKLEKGFLFNHQQYLKEIGAIYTAQMVVISLIYIGFQTFYRFSRDKYPNFYQGLILSIVLCLVPIFHFLLAKKYTKA